MFLEEIYLKPGEGSESKQLGTIYRQGQPIVNNILAMIDVRPPDKKTLKNPLGKKIGNVLCIEGLSALPLQMGPIIYPSDKKHKYVRPLTVGHQEVVDILLSISSEKPAALLLSSAKM